MADTEYLDSFEKTLEQGLVKLCTQSEMLGGSMLTSPDITDKWDNELIKEYMEDAVEEFNENPEVAIAWAAYLGMGMACLWDRDWAANKRKHYKDFYGNRGWDNMDDHIMDDIIGLNELAKVRVTSLLQSCAAAVLGLLRHEHIETQTETGFYILVRVYSVMFALGASVELFRLGYKLQPYQQANA